MIPLLIGVLAATTILGLFWGLGSLIGRSTNEHFKTSDKIGVGFVFTFIIGLGISFCYGLGLLILRFISQWTA